MIIDLNEIATGFDDPVHDAQRAFRTLLDATARPGRIGRIDEGTIDRPRAMSASMAACLLVLCDATTPVWLSASLRRDERVLGFIRFHAGAPVVDAARDAAFAFCARSDLPGLSLADLAHGTDEHPEDGATLVMEVATLDTDPHRDDATQAPLALRLQGPGIEHAQSLTVDGPDATFWAARIAMQPAYPTGIDLLLCAGGHCAAIPRSTLLATRSAGAH
ncbi:MAG: phosphonate C-P lyase system protein PhnH [Lautropia sp.]